MNLNIPSGATLNIAEGATLNIAEGASLNIPSGATLSNEGTLKVANENSITGEGTVAGEGSYSRTSITEEEIIVPENLVYTGEDLTEVAKEQTSLSAETTTMSILGKEFVTATDWSFSIEPEMVKVPGTYTATYTNGTKSVSKTFEVKKAQSPANLPDVTQISVPNTVKTVSEVSISENTVSGNDVYGKFIWDETSAAKTIPAGESVEAVAVYTGEDADCYETTSVVITISRAECVEDEEILFTGEGEHVPTCTESGMGHTECVVCGDVIRISFNATGHIHTMMKNDKEATCAEAGYTGDTWCNDCETYTLSGDEIPKLTHTWNAGEVTKEPTTTQTGVKTYTCTICQTTKTETIPKLSVAPDEGNQGGANAGGGSGNQTPGGGSGNETPGDGSGNQTPDGESGNQTPGGGSGNDNPSQPLPAKGTVFEDAKTGASYKITLSDSKKGTVDYVKPLKKTKTVTISKTVELKGVTYKVTGIAANAFKNNTKLTKVTIGSNVTKIGKNAFSGCTKLKTATIGKNVKTIDAKAFYKCKALTKITIPSKVNKIGKQAFQSCSKLKNITIKTTKLTSKNVGSKAFKGTPANAKVKVPKSKVSAYKKLLVKKGVSNKAKISK